MPPALPFPMVAHFPVQISKLPLRLPAPNRRSTNDLTFQPAHAAKSCRFRSYENLTPFCRNRSSNPFRIRSYRKCARKSFRMRSYKNTGGGAASARPRHPLLPPSYAPRGASIPFGLTRLRILPVTTGVYPLQPQNPLCALRASVANPLLSYSCRLFVVAKKVNPFAIKEIQPLFAKPPGWGVPYAAGGRMLP